jgi:hypothetical protein
VIRLAAGGVLSAVACGLVIAATAAERWQNLTLVVATGLVAVVAWLVTRRPAGPRTTITLLAFAALSQLPGLSQGPLSSTDAYRYVWDGRVSLSGVSPYAHVPLDDDLAALRDPLLFPGIGPDDRTGIHGPPRLPADPSDLAARSEDDPRTRINRPQVPTIYPPVAQIYFAAVALLTPGSAGTFGLQLAAAALAVVLTWLVAAELRRGGRDERWALLWGWSPMVALESGSAAHVDVLSALLVVGAVVAFTRKRPVIAGVLLGAAASVKLVPLLLLPAFTGLRLRAPFVAIGTLIASYLPYLATAGTLVLGFLPGYLTQEGFSDGSRSSILGLVLPPDQRRMVAVVLAIGLALLAVARSGREPVAVTCCWLYGAALLITTPTYPWYSLPLIALAVLAWRIEWLAVPLATYLAYASSGHDIRQGLIFLVAAVIVVSALVRRSTGVRPAVRLA